MFKLPTKIFCRVVNVHLLGEKERGGGKLSLYYVQKEKFCNYGCVKRFLKAKDDNVKKAAKQLRACLSWRDTIATGIGRILVSRNLVPFLVPFLFFVGEEEEKGVGWMELARKFFKDGRDVDLEEIEVVTVLDLESRVVTNRKIRAILSNASDNVYCILLAQSIVHGAMADYTSHTSGLVNVRQTYIPFY
ncbi:hypothetical protein S83_023395, partial [Arachis hypogaea]